MFLVAFLDELIRSLTQSDRLESGIGRVTCRAILSVILLSVVACCAVRPCPTRRPCPTATSTCRSIGAELDRATFTQLVNDRDEADPSAQRRAANDHRRASGDTAPTSAASDR